MVEQAVFDYKKFRLDIDITVEEHFSKRLIPILTVNVSII